MSSHEDILRAHGWPPKQIAESLTVAEAAGPSAETVERERVEAGMPSLYGRKRQPCGLTEREELSSYGVTPDGKAF
jgi:hypothetical protein